MRKMLQYLNIAALLLLVIGFSLVQSFGKTFFPGPVFLMAGGLCLVFYFLLHVKKLKDKRSRMNFIYTTNMLVVLSLTVTILGAVNYLGSKLHKRFDFSEGRIYSLSDQSVRVIGNLSRELKIRGFFTSQNPSLESYNSLMGLYRYHSRKISVEVINPDRNPSLVASDGITRDGTVVIEYGQNKTRIEQISEPFITNAIIQVTRLKRKVVYFIQGHGEPDLDDRGENGYSSVKDNLEKMFYRVKKLVLLQEAGIPDDASVLVVAGPRKPLFQKELEMIRKFIENQKGGVFLMIDPGEGEGIKPLLIDFGVRLEDDVVVDSVSSVMGGDYFIPVVAQYGNHPITRDFNYATFFPLARSLSPVSPPPDNTRITFIATTSPNSWGEKQYESEVKSDRIVKNPDEVAGPLNIIAAIEINGKQGHRFRMVACGDSDFVSNKYFYFSANGNLFTNCISWLADEGDLVAISPATTRAGTLQVTRSESRLLFFYQLIFLPLIVFAAGIAVWLYRRKL